MLKKPEVDSNHPLRVLFRHAIHYGFKVNPLEKKGVEHYLEEQILCEFISMENLYKINNDKGEIVSDVADMLAEGDVMMNANSFDREFEVHKHIGDYTLFMLGMFPAALNEKNGKEFLLGRILVPDSQLSEQYVLQGRRSYSIASEFTDSELFAELSENFVLYSNVLNIVRIYLVTCAEKEIMKRNNNIGCTD
ncbi:MAG: hypothetical protein ISR96_02840 [Nitrospira sp.]|nr:hypothetical protein [bacterium]MBL7048451.1 hypothetical protein [Nitrospira sp.]